MRTGRKAVSVASALAIAIASSTPALAKKPRLNTQTPIQHVVVIFQENVSFDHYFGTYPVAANTDGSQIHAAPGTPSVNGLTPALLNNNPNAGNSANDPYAIAPFRLNSAQASTCDQNHNYGAEQRAFDGGLMDLFPASVGVGGSSCSFDYGTGQGLVMGYFDGNTVTALWNYAQHFAMSDNSYGTTFGPSTPGVLNLVAGNTYPATLGGSKPVSPKVIINTDGEGTLVGDLDPTGDECSSSTTVQMGGKNVGDLLAANGITWGSFMGGFDLTIKNPNGTTGCDRSSPATAANGGPTNDYIPHHAFFQYWASTANPNHTRPSSVYNIGNDGPANHEYALHDFFDALNAGVMPAVSFIKAPAWGDGHAGYSDPLLEQTFLVNTINAIEKSKFWSSTAIIISYDDSDGWYDHQIGPIINSSSESDSNTNDPTHENPAQYGDYLNGPGKCGNGTPLADSDGNPIEGRCGYGPRLPLMVISLYAKPDFVDNTLTDQSSVLRFIEDNWELGLIGNGSYDKWAGTLDNMFDFSHPARGKSTALILDPTTGEVVNGK
jgi:phospholipase C